MTAEQAPTLDALKPYPTYKDSGVDWIGRVPAGWDTFRLRKAAEMNRSTLREETPPDLVINYIEISDVDGLHQPLPTPIPFGEAPSRARRLTRQGDVIISTVRTYLKAVQHINAALAGSVVSTGFAVLTPRSDVQPGFLKYAVLGNGFLDEVIARSRGVSYPAIEATQLGNIPLPVPTTPEQTAIAAFLDHETARIDELVREQELLLEDLAEKGQTLVSQAITRGLGPNVAMKDSGVEWIGKIPAHWKAEPIKKAYSIQLGKMLQPEPSDNSSVETPYLRAANVQDGWIQTEDIKSMYMSPSEITKFSVAEGDLLILEGGDIGRSALVPASLAGLTIQNSLHRVRGTTGNPRFLRYAMQHIRSTGILDVLCNKATIQHLTGDKLAALVITQPPADEQDAIVSHLDESLAQIDQLVLEARANIEDMKLLRSTLITAATTGKIDVRDWRPG